MARTLSVLARLGFVLVAVALWLIVAAVVAASPAVALALIWNA